MGTLQSKIDQLNELGEKAGYVIASFGLEIQEKDRQISALEKKLAVAVEALNATKLHGESSQLANMNMVGDLAKTSTCSPKPEVGWIFG